MIHLSALSAANAPDTVILAKGEFPESSSIAYDILRRSMFEMDRHVYCCDGAYNKLSSLSWGVPDMVIGDLDSITEERFPELRGRVLHVAEQETNDLTKAVRYALSRSADPIPLCLLSTCGLREDHTVANISLFTQFLSYGAEYIVAPTSYGCFYAVSAGLSISVQMGQQISVFNLGARPISSKGLKWELDGHLLPEWWMGTLNQAMTSEISIQASAPIILYIADECKRV